MIGGASQADLAVLVSFLPSWMSYCCQLGAVILLLCGRWNIKAVVIRLNLLVRSLYSFSKMSYMIRTCSLLLQQSIDLSVSFTCFTKVNPHLPFVFFFSPPCCLCRYFFPLNGELFFPFYMSCSLFCVAGHLCQKRWVWDGLWKGRSDPWARYASQNSRSQTPDSPHQQNGRSHSELELG